MSEKSFLAENGANLRKVRFVHVIMSRVQYIRYRLQHMCSVYSSVHYDRERDGTKERLLPLLERQHGPKILESRNLHEG